MYQNYNNYKNSRKQITFKTLEDNIAFGLTEVSIAILIPHRNRLEHLQDFIKHITQLDKTLTHQVDVYIVDQNNGDKFNRGLLLNLCYYIAKNNKQYDRYIFHDVDSYPDQTIFDLYFKKLDCNIHFASPKLGYKYTFDNFFGGILGMTGKDFELINGFPNTFFGWGGEDDSLYNRVAFNNIQIYRPYKGSYILPDHDKPKKEELNVKKQQNILDDLKNWKNNGIKQLENFFINIKEYNNLQSFIDTYDKENSNITNGSTLLTKYKQEHVSNNKINFYFYKIDYLSTHGKSDVFLNKNFIEEQIRKKVADFKRQGIKYFQHKKNPTYISIIEPLIYWDEIESKIIETYVSPNKYTQKKVVKNNRVNRNIKKLVMVNIKDYKSELTKTDLSNTIKFIFNTYNELLYFRIRDNKIVCAYHLYNPANNHDWYKNLKFNSDNKLKKLDDTLQEINEKHSNYYYTLRKPHYMPANNCLLGFDAYNYFEGNSISYIKEYIEMLEYTINKFQNVPDCDILINRKDFAYITKDFKYAYDHLVSEQDKDNEIEQELRLEKYWFVSSQSKKNNYLDVLVPSADEWQDINKMSNIHLVDWSNKKPIAFFRGSSTGCGYNIKNNPRLRLADISFNWNKTFDKKNLLDVGISKLTHRLKTYKSIIGMIDRFKYKYLEGSFVDQINQLKYKYIFNIEGNAQAYRFSNEFKKGSVILNVESEYHMWFEPLLKDGINNILIKSDYSNLHMKLLDLKENDANAEFIAKNGMKFSNSYITKDSIATYWFFYMFYINKYSC